MVTFNWRDYSDGNKVKEMTVTAVEFIRRFMLHKLPSGFRKIRHYGILAPRGKPARIALCKKLTNTAQSGSAKPSGTAAILKRILGDKLNICPACGAGHMTRAAPIPPIRTA